MTDHEDGRTDLSLLIDSEEERPARSGHRRPRRRRRGVLGLLLALAVIAALVFGVLYGVQRISAVFSDVPDYSGPGTGSVQIRVDQGDTASDIAVTLVAEGVVRSERAFRDAAVAEPASVSIQPGLYELRQEMEAALALALLLDPASRLVNSVTIPEGFTAEQVLTTLAEVTTIPREDFDAAAAQAEALGLPAYAEGRLEGFLFPSTYEFDPEDDALSILQAMVAQFTAATTGLQIEDSAAALGLTPYQLVTVASMIQSESRLDAERPMIARVVYNRLDQGIPLGIDATSAYELGKSGTELTTEDFQSASPYNTRRNPGVPPTPISNPGLVSLEAALAPADGPWIYYVLESEDGSHFFTDSAAEFEAAKARCREAGLGCG